MNEKLADSLVKTQLMGCVRVVKSLDETVMRLIKICKAQRTKLVELEREIVDLRDDVNKLRFG